uniref:NADH-ubiquinone oxidoreductase chain 4 n=1 Tax=Ruditapes philippinarum TaxID=129788 RepID=Q7YF52_RUDPH|nr:NADH dehydrogenase subunit 4 [Ruditapes philippinarum]
MSCVLMLSVSCILWGLGMNEVGWLIMVCAVALLVVMMDCPFNFYILKSEWLGVDEMSVLMVLLCLLVSMMSLVSSTKEVKNGFVVLMSGWSVVEMVMFICLGSVLFFSVCSWMDFFFFFEFSLVPTFFLILKWGYQPERLQAAVFMLLYTVGSSLPLLMSLVYFWSYIKSDNMLLSKMVGGWKDFNMNWPWLIMSLSFLVKLPVYGAHAWLPKAHVEAPLSGSMLLAGVLLKFGGYGLIRLMWFSEVTNSTIVLFVLVFSLWGGVLSSGVCSCQSDLKSLIAYSSIGHMALSLSVLLSFYSVGKMACVCVLYSHGICSPILFSLAANSYEFCQSRSIMLSKGISRIFPVISGVWFFFCILNMGFPPSLNFFSEVYSVGGLLSLQWLLGLMGGLMCLMTGAYCLILYSLVNHGVVSSMVFKPGLNLSYRYLVSSVFGGVLLLGGTLCLDMFFV